MFTNYFYQTYNYLKSTSTTGEMSNSNVQKEYYKIPSTPLTRSQCDNRCSANCLVHKKRKRKPKLTESALNNNLDLSSSLDTESNEQLDETASTTSSTNLTTSSKKMTKRRSAMTTSASKLIKNNNLILSDDEGIDEDHQQQHEIVHNNVTRFNYYENFTNDNNASEATGSGRRRAFTINSSNGISQLLCNLIYPISIGCSIVFLISIYLWSTSQLNSNSILDLDNRTFLNSKLDQLKQESYNLRAIESFKLELKQSFSKLNQRIDKVELDLSVHLNSQSELNKQLNGETLNLIQKFKQTDQAISELNVYKVQIDKFIAEFKLSLTHSELECKFNEISRLIKEALDKYDADKTGIVDYASEFAGGEIVSTGCTESYDLKGASYKILGVPIWSPSNIPRFVIQPNTSPGQCWYFKGNKGSLVIKLSRTILPESFSYEHIPVRNAPDGHINSAPKQFEVRALDDENADANWLLGEFEYNKNGDAIQFFKFQNTDKPIEYIEFNILDNHGNEEFTCLYRIRVHGIRVHKEE